MVLFAPQRDEGIDPHGPRMLVPPILHEERVPLSVAPAAVTLSNCLCHLGQERFGRPNWPARLTSAQ